MVDSETRFMLKSAYIFKWHPNQQPNILCKVQTDSSKASSWEKIARTHAYETRPRPDNFT